MKKHLTKKYILGFVAILLMVSLVAAPFIIDSAQESSETKASILSGTVGKNSISKTISGTGTITEDEATEIQLPEGVRLKSYLVSNGQKVKAGDALAEVDRVSVMEVISSVQESMTEIESQMNSLPADNNYGLISSPVSGTIKALYASSGDKVMDVMAEHGALAVISLDGLMAVDIKSNEQLVQGDSLSIVFSDGTEKVGSVKNAVDGLVTIILPDENYPIGEVVQVLSGSKIIGEGKLYVNSQWNAIGISGDINYVYLSEGTKVYSGSSLFYLLNTGSSAQRELLAQQHREYEELMFELFKMYQDELIKAPVDGEISGISKDTVELLSSSNGFKIQLLSNAPDGNNEVSYTNYVGMVTEDGVLINPVPQPVSDYIDDLGSVDITVTDSWISSDMSIGTVYVFDGSAWRETTAIPGDILLFAADESGAYVWAVYVTRGELPETDKPTEDPEKPSQGGTKPDGGFSGGMDFSGGGAGGFSGSPALGQEEEDEYFPLEGTVIMSVTPLENAYVTLSIDELDILSLSEGQAAQVTIDALPGQSFEGTVEKIIVSGDSRKYSVRIHLPRNEKMVGGMNASVNITVDNVEDVVSIPVEAVVNIGSKNFVYTGFDKKENIVTNPVEVECGISDGINVEVNLAEETEFWYEYFDTAPIQFPEFK